MTGILLDHPRAFNSGELSFKYLGPSINGLVTDGNVKLCFRGFILAMFHSTTAYKINSERTRDYTKLFPICKSEILKVTVNKIEVLSSFLGS